MHAYRNGKSDQRRLRIGSCKHCHSELVPVNTATLESASVNFIELNQDLGQSPEEPQASSAQEGKPRCI